MSDVDRASRGPRANEQMVDRLLAGLEMAIKDRGYTETTVSHIVAATGTSKRSFYENFSTKGDCLLEHHTRFHQRIMADIAREAPLAESSFEATVIGVEIYFRAFVTQPHIARAHLLDILTIGQEGLEARAAATWGYVRGMQSVMGTARPDRPAQLLDDARGLGILGGLNEIALDLLVRRDVTMIDDAVERAVDFVRSIIRDLPPLENGVDTPAPA